MGFFGNRKINKERSFTFLRERMVEEQIVARGVKDRKVLNAMLKVERHLFIPKSNWKYAYDDNPVPIGYGQTISQPYIVAFMTEALMLKGSEKVLEIGTGLGYQAAVLSLIASKVYSIEIIEELAESAVKRLKSLGYYNIEVKAGDGYEGMPEYAPFDAIILTAAPDKIPQPLIEQLAKGGRLVAPVGRFFQDLVLIEKNSKGEIKKRKIASVRFVPMTGKTERLR